MVVLFRQVYIEPGVEFQFSHLFPGRLSDEVTALVEPSSTFAMKYGVDYSIIISISAKSKNKDNQIYGPAVFEKARHVEYTIFLPYRVITRKADYSRATLNYLFKGICSVFGLLAIDTTRVLEMQDAIIDSILNDPTMFSDEKS